MAFCGHEDILELIAWWRGLDNGEHEIWSSLKIYDQTKDQNMRTDVFLVMPEMMMDGQAFLDKYGSLTSFRLMAARQWLIDMSRALAYIHDVGKHLVLLW